MTIDDATLLRETLEITLANDATFPRRFYELLFAAHPEVRAMFQRNSPGAQAKMFAQKLTAIVDHVDDPDWMNRELAGIAHSHAGYGATAEMYPWVGEALIQAVKEACADAWSEDAARAWRSAYASVTEVILKT